jgi:hypothetical protein
VQNFDNSTVILPFVPSHGFWQRVSNVSLIDLALLVAPSKIVICEGNPASATAGKNSEHDARSTQRLSRMNSRCGIRIRGYADQVSGDFLAFAIILPKVTTGMRVRRLIDLDDRFPAKVSTCKRQGITTLSRHNIESYMFDAEVLTSLCTSVGRSR